MISSNHERALLFGLAAGMRASSPLVASAAGGRPLEWYALLGEFVADKLPFTPSRLGLAAWTGRIGSAAFGAYRDAKRHGLPILQQMVIAGGTALLATKLAHDVRAGLTVDGPFADFPIALIEDALTLACVVRLRTSFEDDEQLPEEVHEA